VYYDSADLVQADIAKKFDGTGAAILVVARADWGVNPPNPSSRTSQTFHFHLDLPHALLR
jgi:hypothetical protein